MVSKNEKKTLEKVYADPKQTRMPRYFHVIDKIQDLLKKNEKLSTLLRSSPLISTVAGGENMNLEVGPIPQLNILI